MFMDVRKNRKWHKHIINYTSPGLVVRPTTPLYLANQRGILITVVVSHVTFVDQVITSFMFLEVCYMKQKPSAFWSVTANTHTPLCEVGGRGCFGNDPKFVMSAHIYVLLQLNLLAYQRPLNWTGVGNPSLSPGLYNGSMDQTVVKRMAPSSSNLTSTKGPS